MKQRILGRGFKAVRNTIICVVLMVFWSSNDVYATCFVKGNGEICCSAGRKTSCRTPPQKIPKVYTEEELKARKIEAEKRAAAALVAKIEAKRRADAKEMAWKKAEEKRLAEYNLPENVEKRRVWLETKKHIWEAYKKSVRRELKLESDARELKLRKQLKRQSAEIKKLRLELKKFRSN